MKFIILSFLSAAVLATQVEADDFTISNGDIIATTFGDSIIDINPSTGVETPIITLDSVSRFGGLEITDAGVIYATAVASDLTDSDVFRLNLTNGSPIATTLLSSVLSSGNGDGFGERLTLGSNGNLYGISGNGFPNGSIFYVNPVTGVRSTLSVNASLGSPFDLAADSSGNLIVSDLTGNRVIRVNTSTGNVTVLSSGGFLTGAAPGGITVDPATGKIYLLDQVFKRLIEIDPVTGAQTIVSSGPIFNTERTIALNGNTFYVDSPTASINAATGAQALIDTTGFESTIEQIGVWEGASVTVEEVPEPSNETYLSFGLCVLTAFFTLKNTWLGRKIRS